MATTFYDPFKPYRPPEPPKPGHPEYPNSLTEYSLEIPDGVQNIEYVTLDISKKTRARFAPLTIRQGDRKGTALIATVVDTTGSKIREVDLEMADVYLEMLLPDKETTYKSDISEEVVGNRAVIVIDEEKAGIYAGNAQANIVIEQDDTRVSTQPFRVKVIGTKKAADKPSTPVTPGAGTDDYEQLDNKPKINGIELVGDIDSETFEISYNDLTDKPKINGQELGSGDSDQGITISYNDLTDKPKINGVELGSGDEAITAKELHITYDDIEGEKPSTSYTDLTNKPTINGKTVEGQLSTDDVVDVDQIVTKVAGNVDADTIAQKIIESGTLTDDLIKTASNESILNIVANNSDPVDDHSLDRN